MQPNQDQQPKTSQSFSEICTQAQIFISQREFQKPCKTQLIDKEEQKLALSLTYFKVVGANQAQISKNLEDLRKYQGKWLLGADITPEMKDQILEPIIDQLGLDVEHAKQLCDWYFQKQRVEYEQILYAEKCIANIQQPSTQQLQPQTYIQTRRQELDGWHGHLKKFCRIAVTGVKRIFFVNRMSLVNLVMTLAISQDKEIKAITVKFLKKPNVRMNIIESLAQNVEWEKNFANLSQDEKNEAYVENVLTEQISLLNTLLSFWSEYGADQQEQEAFVRFLENTNFQGKMRQNLMYGDNQAELKCKQEIKILSQLCGIAMMSLSKSNPQCNIKIKVDANQVTQASSFVYFPMARITNQLNAYIQVFDQLPLLEEFNIVLLEALRPGFTLKEQAMGLLSCWLNILFDFESSKNQNSINEQLLDNIREKGLQLLKDQSAIKSVWESLENKQKPEESRKIRIYLEVLQNPGQNYEIFIQTLCRLCGSSRFPYGDRVKKLIKNDVWIEIFKQMNQQLRELDQQKLDEKEVKCLTNTIILLCKIIRQEPDSYKDLANKYELDQMIDRDADEVQFSLLAKLVEALHSLFYLNKDMSGTAICNLLNALTKIYKHFSVTRQMIFELIYDQKLIQHRPIGNPLLIEYMKDLYNLQAKQIVSFLKFLGAVLKQNDSFGYLPQSEVYIQNINFLYLALTNIYTPILEGYSNINAEDEKEKSKLFNEIFRLTLNLLSKFDQVTDDGQKVLLVQSTPFFDYQLQMLVQALDSPMITQMCLDALSVVQGRSLGEGFSFFNKNQLDLNNAIESRHFVRMISSAIQVLNKMISLSLTVGQNQDINNTSLKSTYISNVSSIQTLKQSISDQTRLTMQDQTQLTIPALLTCYIKPNGNMSVNIKIRATALQFVTGCLKVLGHSNFYTTLKTTFGSNLQQQLMFAEILKDEIQIPLSIPYIEFWIQVVETQGNLAEELWMPQNQKVLAETLSFKFAHTFESIENTLKQKICILLAIMSIQRCCVKVIDAYDQQILSILNEKVIKPLLQEVANVKYPLTGDFLASVDSIDATVLLINSSFNAKITIYYYIKLLQSEFERLPDSKTVRFLITDLYQNQAFQALSVGTNPEEEFRKLFDFVQNINENYLRDAQSRPHLNRNRLQSISMIPGFEERFQVGKTTPMQSADDSVYLSNINGKDLYEKIISTKLYHFYNTSLSTTESKGMFGAQFSVDVDELNLKLIECGYDPAATIQIACLFSEFNLAQSMIAVNTFISNAKAEFIMKISQTQMGVVQRNQVPSELVLTASMMALISNEEFDPKRQDLVNELRRKLLSRSIGQVKAIHATIEKSRFKILNTLLDKHLEAQIQNLEVHLGIIGHLVSNLRNDQQLRQEIPNLMVSLISSLPENGFFQSNDQNSHQHFCQLISLILQIQVTLEQKSKTTTILKSFSNVISGMQRGFCMIEGIQIFILICDMIESESLVALMNKHTNGSPMQLIISRIQDPRISNEEMQLILTLLQSFARSVKGSENLFKNKVLSYLMNCESFRLLNQQNPYVVTNQEQNRNHVHTWWLQVLALVRQINTKLVRNPKLNDNAYFKELNKIVKILTPRFQSVLQITLPQEGFSAPSANSVISIAVLEETELICQILSQMFQHADVWVDLDQQTFAEMKDLMLFAVPKVFKTCFDMRTVLPSSVTERHLAGISSSGVDRMDQLGGQNDRTALQLKMEMSMVSAIMASTACLHNIFTLQKQSNNSQMILTWGRIDNAGQSGFEKAYLNTQVREPYIQFAFENYLSAMEGLQALYDNLRSNQDRVKRLMKEISSLFMNDQWILSEYQGGLSSILIEENYDSLLENIEVTLGMGVFVLSGILEQVQSVLTGVEGFTGSSAYKTRHHNLSGWNLHDQFSGQQQIEEKHLFLMAKKLQKRVESLQETSRKHNPNNPPWAQDKYLDSILKYARNLAANKQDGHSNRQHYQY